MSVHFLSTALATATEAAQAAGELLRKHRLGPKKINQTTPHDIKLELDVRSQKLITRILAVQHPEIPVLGEEETDDRSAGSEYRWVVDPIDGTVNFASGIPHACVSIALEHRRPSGQYESVVGVILDPFVEELWTAQTGRTARRNGKVIHPSTTGKLSGAVVSLGFAGSDESLAALLHEFAALTPRVRKLRIMGSAALALAYVADGRFDAFIETGLRRWDIAAGRLLVECAGGVAACRPLSGEHAFAVNCHNGRLDRELAEVI